MRRWALMAALPVVATLSALTHYGARGQFAALLIERNGDFSSYGAATSGGFFLGLVVCAALGPLLGGGALLALGLLVTAAGHAVAGLGPIVMGVALSSAGRVGVSVGLPAVAGRLFAGRREGAIAALCVAIYAGVNGGALLATLVFGSLAQAVGPASALWTSAGLAGLLGIVCLAIPFLEYGLSAPRPGDARAAWAPALLGTSVVVVLLGGAAWTVDMLATELGWTLMDPTAVGSTLMTAANPLGAILAGVVVAIGLAVAAASGFEVPALAVAGVGLLLAGAGFGLSGLAPSASFLGQALGGAGEPLVWGGLTAVAVRGVHWRVAPFGPLALQAASMLASPVSGVVGPELARGVTLGAAGILAFLGLVALGAAWPIRSLLAGVWAAADAEAGSADPAAAGAGADPYGFPANP